MPMLVSITRVSHIPVGTELEELHKAHEHVFGDSLGRLTFLRDPDASLPSNVSELPGRSSN